MKKISLLILLAFLSISIYAQETITDTMDGVTVYTNNGAVVKGKNSKSYRNCEYTCTIEYKDKNTGEMVEVEETHTFNINQNEERTLLQPGGKVTKITITKVTVL